VAEGEALLVAWLLSTHHLTAAEVEVAGARIRSGQAVRPGEAALEQARRALGRHTSTDAGLSLRPTLLLFAVSVVVSPLPGLGAAWTWWDSRPRAARTALLVSAPALVFSWVLRGAVAWAES
jgi:hypothetical protein